MCELFPSPSSFITSLSGRVSTVVKHCVFGKAFADVTSTSLSVSLDFTSSLRAPGQKAAGIFNSAGLFTRARFAARPAIAKPTRASRRCAASRTASIRRLHAIDSLRNASVAAVGLRRLRSSLDPSQERRVHRDSSRRISAAPGIPVPE